MSDRLSTARATILVPLATALLLAAMPLRAQTGKPVFLEHADSLLGTVIDGLDVRELKGNVLMSQENVRLRCDRALQFVLAGRVELTGNVVVEQDSMTLLAPRALYHRDERRAEGFDGITLIDGRSVLTALTGEYLVDKRVALFRQRVVVRDSASTVSGDSLIYSRDEKRSVVMGHVSVHYIPDRIVITGGHLVHAGTVGYSRMTEDPVLVQLDSSARGRDTLVVRSMIMEAVEDSLRRFIATDSVSIVRKGLAALCGRAIFFSKGDSIRLRALPVVWYERTQVLGDSIDVYLQGRALSRVEVMGSAVAVSQSDSTYPNRYDQLSGERLRMKFANRALDRIDVENQAISIYYVYEDTAANGLNRTSGDRIVMTFEKGKIRRVRVFGGVEGQYVPEKLVWGRESEFRIPGFVWRTDRPTLTDTLGGAPARARTTAGRKPAHE
jgi:hypothetical protein